MDISDQELAELKRKAHAFDSDQGRLQKTQAELDSERRERAELEKRLAVQQQAQIDPEAERLFGPDGVTALRSMLAPVLGKLDTIGKRFDEQSNADAQARTAREYWGRLDERLAGNNLPPGFASRLRDGDLASVWTKFLDSRPSVKRAQAEADIESVSDAVYGFINQNKELVTGGGYSPQSVPGFSPAVKSDYSDADYQRDISSLERQKENLAIDEAEYGKQANAIYDRWVAAQQKVEKAQSAYGLV